MSEIKLKIRCECRQKIRVPARKVGTKVPCPGCSAEVLVPQPPHPVVIEVQCRCGQIVPSGEAFCLGCGLGVLDQIANESREPEKEKVDEEKRGEKQRPGDFAGPYEIPDGHELSERALVKFLCRCGQKVRLKWKQRGDGEPCPRCKEPLPRPDVTKDPNVSVLCSCETVLERGRTRCPKCDREIVVPIAQTLLVSIPRVEDTVTVSPVAPTVIAGPGPTPLAPPPLPATGPKATEPVLRPVGTASTSSRRRAESRRRSLGPVLVFWLGLVVLAAGIGWLFWGGPDGAPEKEEKPAPDPPPAVPWERKNPFEEGGGEGKEKGGEKGNEAGGGGRGID